MRPTRIAALLGLAVASVVAHGWSATGHMVIAAIAKDELSVNARAEAERLLLIGANERTNTFLTAAVWADDLRDPKSAPWHYINLHFRNDGKPVADHKHPDENAVVAIERFRKILGDRTKPDAERADALRYVLHFVGDLHQPLHAVARDTDEFPTGDRGGNDFRIQPPSSLSWMSRPPSNLHSLWDSGAGLFLPEERPLSTEAERRVRNQAQTLVAALPRSSFTGLDNLDPMKWAEEGLAVAKKVVYALPEGSQPTEEYMVKSRQVAARQSVAAGYRLADILNQTLK